MADSNPDADGAEGRRAFLKGALLGVGVTAGVTLATRGLGEDEQPVAPDAPAPAEGSSPSAPGEIPPPPDDVGPMPPDGRRLSYAQQGEDLVLRAVFEHLGITTPSYLDIGAFHPSISNNTFLLYVLGSRGVLVEPNPSMVALLQRARPGDTVLGVGVSIDERTEADYYVVRDRPQLNTFSREQADRYVAESGAGAIARTLRMPLRSIDSILQEHFADAAPDLLSVDVEGLDLPLLQSLSWSRFRPAVICVETLIYGTARSREPIAEHLREHGYGPRAGTFVNTIFVDEQRWPSGGAR